jgi:hypothetical protein
MRWVRAMDYLMRRTALRLPPDDIEGEVVRSLELCDAQPDWDGVILIERGWPEPHQRLLVTPSFIAPEWDPTSIGSIWPSASRAIPGYRWLELNGSE